MRRRLKNNQKGSVFVISAAFLPALVGISVLMIDVAIAFSAKTRVEHVAIQAAEAAALRLPDGTSAVIWAEDLASDLLPSVLFYATDPQVSATSDGSQITVTVTVRSKTFLAGIFGVNGLVVTGSAARS